MMPSRDGPKARELNVLQFDIPHKLYLALLLTVILTFAKKFDLISASLQYVRGKGSRR